MMMKNRVNKRSVHSVRCRLPAALTLNVGLVSCEPQGGPSTLTPAERTCGLFMACGDHAGQAARPQRLKFSPGPRARGGGTNSGFP